MYVYVCVCVCECELEGYIFAYRTFSNNVEHLRTPACALPGVVARVPHRDHQSSQCVTDMSSLVSRAMSEEMQRITRVVDTVPANVDIVIDSRNCLRAPRRMGIFTEN